ncbi:major royal jelly protein-domain-containing protein [Hypoxylon argillaceum]|nr:major royal jelly protein-domain-containing protein [Hypoxylon argillaceum]KAI1145142.1 major royal jelly protein-domain-containing protein [Nemania diffusa]
MAREKQLFSIYASLVGLAAAQFPTSCPAPSSQPNGTLGVCPNDFAIIGPSLEAVHEGVLAPTGLAIDPDLRLYLTYPRNSGATPNNVVICTSFTDEAPWPSAAIQNCTSGQDPSTCFINVQNIVLDSVSQLWVVDSGIPPGAASPVVSGAKIMSFALDGTLLSTYHIPEELLHDNLNLNDMRVNNTLGTKGYAFLTDASKPGSLLSIDLDTGYTNRRLFNTTYTHADEGYVGIYDGRQVYAWNGTYKSSITTSADGIALASGNLYWGVLASRRYYYISQGALVDPSLSDADLLSSHVRNPGQVGTEQAGFTADDTGRVYMLASEHNAIFYVDTLQARVKETINGVPGGSRHDPYELVAPDNYVVKTLVRSGLIQHADSAAVWDGWLYFCTNQLALAPNRQYNNIEARRGPFRSYRVWIGAGPAV